MTLADVVVVAIGRNEGERLKKCLESVRGMVALVVYVDSGSTDGSVETARHLGAEVVLLDLTQPFTAARARNAGYGRALDMLPGARFVQFVDGDCEVQGGWLELARDHLCAHAHIAVVCGRRREWNPDSSPYNRLCDVEWNTPIGEAKACGGDAMFRAQAFNQVSGFRAGLIAGEEPELCLRLRAVGWGVERLDADMTMHDAAILRFGQWWKRSVRGGYAFAEGAHLHGRPPEKHWVYESRRALVWGAWLPACVLCLMALVGPFWAVLFLIYPLQMVRLYVRDPDELPSTRLLKSVLFVVSRFPEALGYFQFMRDRFTKRQATLIEYK